MNNLLYATPEMEIVRFALADSLSSSSVVTTAPSTTLPGSTVPSTGGINLGGDGGDGSIDFDDIP